MIHSIRKGFDLLDGRVKLKLIIILAELCIAALLGILARPILIMLVIISLVGAVAFLVFTRHLEWGLVMLVPVTFLVPLTVGTGTEIRLNITFLFVGFLFVVWILKMVMLEKEFRLVPSRLNTPVILFIISCTISLLVGNTPLILQATERASLIAQMGGWLLYAFSVGILLLAGNIIQELRWLKWLTWIFLVLGFVYTLSARTGFVEGINSFFKEGISTGIFWIMLVALSSGQALFNRELSLRWRIVIGLITVIVLYLGWFLGKEWVVGWLAPLIAVWVLVWLRSWRGGFLITALVGLLMIPFSSQFIAPFNTGEQSWSTYTRFVTWPIMLNLIKASPVFGLGPANYYHYTRLFNYFGYYVKFNSHNNYFDIAAQYGLIGLILFIWIIIEIARLAWRLRSQVRDGFSQAYVNSCIAILVAMLVAGAMADWFLPFLYNIGIPGFRTSIFAWVFLGGLISLDQISKKSRGGEQAQLERYDGTT